MSTKIDIPCSKCNGTGRASADDPARYLAQVRDMTAAKSAKLIREAAEYCLSHTEDCDKGLVEMYTEDARDLRRVAKLCGAGNFAGALKAARDMDTAPRERIPQLAYHFMCEQTEG